MNDTPVDNGKPFSMRKYIMAKLQALGKLAPYTQPRTRRRYRRPQAPKRERKYHETDVSSCGVYRYTIGSWSASLEGLVKAVRPFHANGRDLDRSPLCGARQRRNYRKLVRRYRRENGTRPTGRHLEYVYGLAMQQARGRKAVKS